MGSRGISIADFEKPDGSLDWDAYKAAQLANGEICEKCRAFIYPGCGHRQRCAQCRGIDTAAREIKHDRFIVCPRCRRSWSPWDGYDGLDDIAQDGEHRVTCECEYEFIVETRVSYTFTSKRPEGDDPDVENGDADEGEEDDDDAR